MKFNELSSFFATQRYLRYSVNEHQKTEFDVDEAVLFVFSTNFQLHIYTREV
jgi:hypothetical protein